MALERLDKLLSRLGYCSRREVPRLLREERLRRKDGKKLRFDTKVENREILFDDKELDPDWLFIALNKPTGYVCSRSGDEGRTVFELLPARFSIRNPPISTVGRLDKDSSGLLLLTDDGELIHKLTSPHKDLPKCYKATLARELRGDEGALFASGTLVLSDPESERESKRDHPLKPAVLEVINPHEVRLTITQGRYHQVRRMFRAVGNEVVTLHREAIGALSLSSLGALKEGEFQYLTPDDAVSIFG